MREALRPRGINSIAVNVSVIIVGRHASIENETKCWSDIELEIEQLVLGCGRDLRIQKWTDEDIALASFIRAVGVIAKYDAIVDVNRELSLKESISRCARLVERNFPALSLKIRNGTKN